LEIPLPCYLTKFESGILKIHEYIIVGVQSHTVAHFSLLRTIHYVLYHNANTLHGAFSSFPVIVFPIFLSVRIIVSVYNLRKVVQPFCFFPQQAL
jgi:hypothetical protein